MWSYWHSQISAWCLWNCEELQSENCGSSSHSHSSVSCCLLSFPPLSLSTSRPVLIYSPSSFCQAVFGAMLEPVPPIPLICLLSATPRTATSSWMVAMLTMSQVRILPPFHQNLLEATPVSLRQPTTQLPFAFYRLFSCLKRINPLLTLGTHGLEGAQDSIQWEKE